MNSKPHAATILSPSEVAKLLKVPPSTLIRWLRSLPSSELPVIKIGKHRRFL
ncbi:MAG: helix-turn-helix domain-containing protein, partial [Puniceicoccales bacterium]|nr:helix-turn-helix domain-containing protein [Puniceicoccales bacterium]